MNQRPVDGGIWLDGHSWAALIKYRRREPDEEECVVGQTKKRLASLLVILMVLFAGHTLAEGKSYIPCKCLFGKCTCFIQNGDEGGAVKRIVEILIEK